MPARPDSDESQPATGRRPGQYREVSLWGEAPEPKPKSKAKPAAPAPVEPNAGFARIALDTPVRREFSYRVPVAMSGLEAGQRVKVPFGARELVGVVVGIDPHPPADVAASKLKAVRRCLDAEPLLTAPLLRLARHLAESTYCSVGQAAAAMLPAALRKDRPRRTIRTVELSGELASEEREALAKRYPKQEKALAYLEAAGGPVELRDFLSRTGLSASPVESLVKRGLATFGKKLETFDPFADAPMPEDKRPVLTEAQRKSVDAICTELDAGRAADFLLFGVTGSGKTEVYLRALERCLEAGRGAIVLVPEIALTPQTVARFRARCGEVAVLHSGLTDAERHDQWQALRHGKPRVVVGARSALFAPIPNLGLIVVDEEHETSFKQEQTPRYHARDVARERARLEHAVCILGSATPSLESWQDALNSRLHMLELPDRVAGGSMPPVELVDMREEKPEKGHWNVISRPLMRALGGVLERDERAILFLNRRGFAPAWHCRGCGGSVHCPRCDVALTFHRWRQKAVCHFCLAEHPEPTQCGTCRGPLTRVGVGTERAEDSLKRAFPNARVARMDRDTMIRRESYEQLLGDFGAGKYDFLLGTQMVAKGLDFPDVTLVGVLNADTALHHPDFRAAERCFDLVSQVSGRAGRSARGGRVVVQTWNPEHPALQAAVHHDYRGFATRELEERDMFGFPPAHRAVRLLFEGTDATRVKSTARETAEQLRAAGAEGAVVLGPAAPPVEKLRGRYRQQILVKLANGAGNAALDAVLYERCQQQGVTVDPL